MKLLSMFKREKDKMAESKLFTVSVTSGLPSIDRATVTQELQGSMGKGMDMIQIDVESVNHIGPDDKKEIENLSKSQGIRWGIHADLTIDPSKADKVSWDLCDNAFKKYIDLAKGIKGEYVNFHNSVHPAPYITEQLSGHPPACVTPDGKSILTMLTDDIIEGIMKSGGFSRLTRTKMPSNEDLKEEYTEHVFRKNMRNVDKTNEELARFKSDDEVIKTARKWLIKSIKESLTDEMYEWDAYRIVAWDMYFKKDPIWMGIVGNKDPKRTLEEKEGHMKLTDAVAGRYLEGHLRKILDKLSKTDIEYTIENCDARGGAHKGEKVHRLMLPQDIYHVVKKINHPQIKICIDWEHIAMQGFDPWKEVKKFPGDIGKFVNKFDVNSYPNVNHIQHPVERGDVNLYTLLWEVRQRGLKKAVLNYEWGGGRGPEQRWGHSVVALKQIAKYLEENVPPKELPPEFFGMSQSEIEIERAQMRRNMFKPLEGSLDFPEADAGWVGKSVVQKGQLEKWKREEFK